MTRTRSRWTYALAVLLLVAAFVTIGGMVACFAAAIWTHGPDLPERLAGTGFLLLLANFVTVPAATMALAVLTDA